MNVTELLPFVEQYRAGLDAELALLRRLQAIAADQQRASEGADFTRVTELVDERDRVMTTLVTVEHELKGVRQQLLAARDRLAHLPAFQQVVDLHRTAADLVSAILSVDEHSLAALKEAEEARRVAAQALEQGESTLAAYRRVVSPGIPSASIMNRRG